ncbi:MAG: amino acid--tRNA ligase-related protein [Nanoarchaeota archaeon]
MDNQQEIQTGMGKFSREKFDALTHVREVALDELRSSIKSRGYREVTTSTLVNIAGSCENPYASFRLNYYGTMAHLSQSAQIQLENLVLGLNRGFFTVNNSFREENYDDPEAEGRRLSEFTLIEPEKPYNYLMPHQVLDKVICEITEVMKVVADRTLKNCSADVRRLGGDIKYLEKAMKTPWSKLTYDEALELLNGETGTYKFGDDLGVKEERAILRHFNNIPIFITHYPAAIKFFNMKRERDGQRAYSVDLLMPRLGETVGGAVREENGEVIKQQLRESRIALYLQEQAMQRAKDLGQDPEKAVQSLDPVVNFSDYFGMLEQVAPVLRGGYGIGFERFVGFLLQSNDILNTITHRTLLPRDK